MDARRPGVASSLIEASEASQLKSDIAPTKIRLTEDDSASRRRKFTTYTVQ